MSNRRYTYKERVGRMSITVSLMEVRETDYIQASEVLATGKLADDRNLSATVNEMRRDDNVMHCIYEFRVNMTDDWYVQIVGTRRQQLCEARVMFPGPIWLTRDEIFVPDAPTPRQQLNLAEYNKKIKNNSTRDISVRYKVEKTIPITIHDKLMWIGTHKALVRLEYKSHRCDPVFDMYHTIISGGGYPGYYTPKRTSWINDIVRNAYPHG